MRVLTPGHSYVLAVLDGPANGGTPYMELRFVQRVGDKYPGNWCEAAGTTTQDVLRVLVDRLEYVNAQVPCVETEAARDLLRSALALLELRAKRRRGEEMNATSVQALLDAPVCAVCGHVECTHHGDDHGQK